MQEKYPLPPGWSNFLISRESLLDLWEKLNKFPILFDDFNRGNFLSFLKVYCDPQSVILKTGDYGICRACNIVPYNSAEVHLVFWDRRFKGRKEECVQALRWLFEKFCLHRVLAVIPETAKATRVFAEAIGFKYEGKLRENYKFKGKYLNSVLYGLLRQEIMEEENGQ